MRFFEAKSYELHETSNPLFPRKEAPRKIWRWVVLALVVALVITGLGVAVYGPYLSIKDIQVQGTVTIPSEDIRSKLQDQLALKRLFILPNGHQWFFDAGSAETMLQTNFPLKSVDIDKDGAMLQVTVVEDIFMLAFRSGEVVYFLDPEGKITRLAEPNEVAAVHVKVGAAEPSEDDLATLNADMPVIREKTAVEHQPAEQLFNDVMIENVISFSDGLRLMGIKPVEFVSDDVKLPWFTVTIDKEYVILFDAMEDVDTQLTVLKTVLDERFATQEDQPRYIDVRFGTRVYVR